MRISASIVRAFLSRSLQLDREDKIWKAWLDLKQREWRDLATLIKSDVRDEFKMRAITILLVPHFQFLPFKWPNNSSLTNLLFLTERPVKSSELPDKLREFERWLITMYVEVAREYADEEKIHSALTYYNRYVLDFLAILPENSREAEEVFGCYELRDPVVFSNMDDCSGYNPLYPILNEEIPEKWKRAASVKMHEIIMAEQKGKERPRENHENALQWYVEQIQLPLVGSDGTIRYSAELLAFQIDFVLGLSGIGEKRLFNDWNVGKILKILSGGQYLELRHRFARHVAFRTIDPFFVHDSNTKHAAKAMLTEFSDDADLVSKLTEVVKNCRIKEEEATKYHQVQVNREQSVLKQMK
ncbi:MAG: hypothetical protein AAB837_00745 [Patescibacteria group bacterium]